jgi:hypothetical protein
LNDHTCFIRNHDLLPVEVDDELVMISADQNHFVSLNAMGKFIFDALATRQSLKMIVKNMLACCDEVSEAQCRDDVVRFLKDLVQHRVIVVC